MTCQHCETWILDDDYRCRRCGRRVRSTPARPRTDAFPVETGSAARAYHPLADREIELDYRATSQDVPIVTATETAGNAQKKLFEGSGTDARVIAFDSLTSASERQSIRARAAGLSRPSPLKTEKVQVRHARAPKSRSHEQRRLDFQGQEDLLAPPKPSIICDAPVAPARLRLEAAVIDGFIAGLPCLLGLVVFRQFGGPLPLLDATGKYVLPLLLLAIATIPVFYKLLWVFAGCDSIGMRSAGLRLVDFDGNPPSSSRRYQRFFGSFLSLAAAGIGLIWSLVDEDRLTWHDHISNTFPTLAAEEDFSSSLHD